MYNQNLFMSRIFSYVLRYDDGAAPNPFWNVCTLTICKPGIRRGAGIGDWVVGTGSKRSSCNDGMVHDLSGSMVYAMKVTGKLSLREYDEYCQLHLPNKIPDISNEDWRRRMGDCIYSYAQEGEPVLRDGVHGEGNRPTDLSGENALLSTHFYYFGDHAVPLKTEFLSMVKKSQGYKIIDNPDMVVSFEHWIESFPLNVIDGEPQLKHRFELLKDRVTLGHCGGCHIEEDEDDDFEAVC